MHSSSFTSEGPQEDEEIKCPKCFSFFSSLTKPYILPCNHNICLNCINSLIDEKNPKCPICSFHFNKTDKKSFEVNFTFLNIIIKILETKIIFCPQCNKIFYWKDHYKLCEQKNFQNCDNILDEIKVNCEESAKILRLIKENGDLLNKYKIELYNVTNNIVKEVHKKYLANVKSSVKNKLFETKITVDFQKIKYDMINFIKLFLPYSEYFDTNEIEKIIENNNYGNYSNIYKSNLLCNSYSDIKNKTKAFINKKNALSPPTKNLVKSEKKYQTIIHNNNELNKKINNKINKFLNNKSMRNNKANNNNMKEIISEVKETEEDLSLPPEVTIFDDEGVHGTERVKIKNYHDNNISKFKKINIILPEEINNSNKENKNTIQNEKRKSELITVNPQTHHKKKSKFDIKSILNTEDIDEENTKNKIIVGLKDIKVVSLKQSMHNLNNNKFNLNLIKSKMKLPGKKINLGNINNFVHKKGQKSNNINDNIKKDNNTSNAKLTKKINFDSPTLSLLRSSEFVKRDFKYVTTNQNGNKNNLNSKKIKNNNLNINLSLASTTSGFNNLLNEINTPYIINHASTKENFSSRDNNKKNFLIPQKNSPFVNEKMLKDFNKTKESADKIKKYYEIITFLSSEINTGVDQNISLLKNVIMSNYDLLLSEIAFKSPRAQKNFCFSFFPNTYNIILFDPFNKKLSLKNFSHVLNKKNKTILKPFDLSHSIIFDDNDLIFITGGAPTLDKIIILSLSNENIIYNKSMPCKKSFHKSIFINNKLYLIGGETQNKKVTSECLSFDISQKNWNILPNLKKARKNFSLCFYNDSVLYVFMGEDDKNILDTIEFIDIKNLNGGKGGWGLFQPVDLGFVWHPMKNSMVINIDRDKILICGGEDNENNLYKDSFLFKPSTNHVFKGIDLKVPAAFISEGCLYKDEIFGLDYKNKTQNHFWILHIYNIKNNFWNSGYINNIK